jgi:hypothetical protein
MPIQILREDGRTVCGEGWQEEAPEDSKESLHSAHAYGMNE